MMWIAAMYLTAGAGFGELACYAERKKPGVFGEASLAAVWATCVLAWPLAVINACRRG